MKRFHRPAETDPGEELARMRARLATLERELEGERKARAELAARLRLKGVRSDLEQTLEQERARSAALAQQLEQAWRQVHDLDPSRNQRTPRWRRAVGRA